MRNITAISVGRSDYGIYLPIFRKLQKDKRCHFNILISGMHLSSEFGMTVKMVEADDFQIAGRIESLLSSDTPAGICKSIGLGVVGFAEYFSRKCPDLLVVLGDRFEMYAAALAALPFRIPIAHIHGGEITKGAMDDVLRHSMTKLSHLHFVSTKDYARRVTQMGEEPWRVQVCGAPSLDNLRSVKPLSKKDLFIRYQIAFEKPLLVTFHPVTLEPEHDLHDVDELLSAIRESGQPAVFTLPNADIHGREITSKIQNYVRKYSQQSCLVNNLGTESYFSLMTHSSAMVGNSSSGIIEAPSFKLPVVNIGNRQSGRIKAGNVIDVTPMKADILRGIRKALTPTFRQRISRLKNPYGDGHAAERIVQRLTTIPLDHKLLIKNFYEKK